MGNFYGNITLKCVDKKAVVGLLNAAMKAAFVSPVVEGCLCVFEAESDGDGEALWRLAGSMSRDLECVALAVMNHDDDLLLYQLFDSGELIDSYDSCPSFSSTSSSSNPRGGEASIVCNAFGVPRLESKLRVVLEKKYVTATNQHLEIVHLLGLNEEYSLMGYNELVQGNNRMQLFEPTEEDEGPLPQVVLPGGFIKTGEDIDELRHKAGSPRARGRLRKLNRDNQRTAVEAAFQTNCLHFERMADSVFEELIANPGLLVLRSERPGFAKNKWVTIGHYWEVLDFVLAASDDYLRVLSLTISGGASVSRTEGAKYLNTMQVVAISESLQKVDFDKLILSYSQEEFEGALLHSFDCNNIDAEFDQLRLCFRQLREFFAAAAEREEVVVIYKS